MNKRALLIIFLTVFIDLLGFGIVVPLLPLYAKAFGASATVSTALLASYLIAQAIFAPWLGRLSDRIGRRPVLIASLAGSAASFFLLAWAPSLIWLFAARIISGVTGGSISAAKSYIADITTVENRAHGMGMLGAGIALGYVFGPPVGGILMNHGQSAPYLLAGSIAILNCIAAFFFLPAPPRSEATAATEGLSALAYARSVLSQPQLGSYLWIIFFVTLTFSLFTGTYALLCSEQFLFNPKQTGLLFGFVGIIAAFIQGGAIRPLVKRFGELPLVVLGAGLFAVSMMILPWARMTGWMLFALSLLAGGNSLNGPSLLALVSREAPREEQGRVLGFEQGMESLARITGLLVGGTLFDIAKWMPYALGATLMAAACLLAMVQWTKQQHIERRV